LIDSNNTDNEDEVELVGDYDPEVEEMIRESKRNDSYFDSGDDTDSLEQVSRMEKDPVMSRVTEEDPQSFQRFVVEDEEFSRRVHCVEDSLNSLGLDYVHLDIGLETYESLFEDGKIDDDDVSVFYISGNDDPANLLGDMDTPDTEDLDSNVVISYGQPGYEDTVPLEIEDIGTGDIQLSAPSNSDYERNKPEVK